MNNNQLINEYIGNFDIETQKILQSVRTTIQQAIPEAEEVISYKIPAYKYKGKDVIYFAGFKHHIGLYATPTGHKEFAKELSAYKQGKGSVQFPLDQPMPLELIARIAKFRKNEVKNIVNEQQNKS